MNIDIGKTIRLSDIINAKDGRGLLIDTTIASTMGATEGLEDLSSVLQGINQSCDGIIVNPGQSEHQVEHLGGKARAAPIVRVDWTNAYRNEDFCLPVSSVKRLMISDGEDAIQLGASAVVASMLLGFEDDFEAKNIEELSHLARKCHSISMPVMIDIRPIGPGVSQSNYEESIQLGVSFMQELGAEVLIIPDCEPATYQLIGNWMSVPVLMRLNEFPSSEKANHLFEAELAGIVLTEKIFIELDYIRKLKELQSMIHSCT